MLLVSINRIKRFVFCLISLLIVEFSGLTKEPLNFVIIFTDDQGYGDMSCNGHPTIHTPNLDQMAYQGQKWTQFYSAAAVCTPSRAALMTGRLPVRSGMASSKRVVLFPDSAGGLPQNEITIAEILKGAGYKTGMVGKWHMGHLPEHLPTTQGFDSYYGIPYSNDMDRDSNVKGDWVEIGKTAPWSIYQVPLIKNGTVVERPVNQNTITRRYTEEAVKFITNNKESSFFLYLAHSMPHIPLYASKNFKGKSLNGIYGDVIQEIDWSVGKIIRSLEDNGIDDNTLVIFTTDNGPWLSYGNHAGSAKPLREGKGTAWEGGVRVPCIMRWPNKIPSGKTCSTPAMTIDILPTIAELTGSNLPNHSIWPLMNGDPKAKSPHEAYYFYWGADLHAIRKGNWSLHLPHRYRSLKGQPGKDGIPSKYIQKSTGIALFDLKKDISQKEDLSETHSDIVGTLKNLGEKHVEYVKKNKRDAARY